MSVEFGIFLKALRRERGLSRDKLAQAGGIAVRTLSYWESGRHSPGTTEWQHVLKAIGATPEERAQAAALLTTGRGLRIARQEMQETIARTQVAPIGPLPDLGELLRALRARRRWTQAQVAEAMRVNRVTVNRWEATRSLPTDENLDRLCELLKAFPEERQAFQRRRLEPPHWGAELSWEGCLEQLEMVYQIPTGLPLTELTYLALKRQIHLHLGRETDALARLALMESLHATLLWYQERDSESIDRGQRSLAMLGAIFPGDPIHYGILNLVAVQINRAAGTSDVGLKLYERWLPRLAVDAHQIAPLCDMALFYGAQQRFMEQEALLKQAQHLLKRSRAAMPYHHDYFGTTYGRMLRLAGKPAEAMAFLPRIGDEATTPRATLMQWAATLIEAGDRQTATRYLNQAAHQLAASPNLRAQKEWEKLTRRL